MNNKGYTKIVILFVVAILIITGFSYFSSLDNPKPKNQSSSQYTEDSNQNINFINSNTYIFDIDNYSLEIPLEYQVSEYQDGSGSYFFISNSGPVYIQVTFLNEPFTPNNSNWDMLKQENPDFSYTENMINGFKSYETFRDPTTPYSSFTTYISLSPNKSLVITMAPAINDNGDDVYPEYVQIVNSVKVRK